MTQRGMDQDMDQDRESGSMTQGGMDQDRESGDMDQSVSFGVRSKLISKV